jgi:hypothetical protein
MTKTLKKENIVAYNLLSLASLLEWIVTNVLFIAGIAKSSCWLKNLPMKFYQGTDPNISEPGFFPFHCQVHIFLMIQDINKMKHN